MASEITQWRSTGLALHFHCLGKFESLRISDGYSAAPTITPVPVHPEAVSVSHRYTTDDIPTVQKWSMYSMGCSTRHKFLDAHNTHHSFRCNRNGRT